MSELTDSLRAHGQRHLGTDLGGLLQWAALHIDAQDEALAAQMDELAGDVMALDEGHWAYGQDLSDWAGIVDEWAAGLAAKDKTWQTTHNPKAYWRNP